VSCALLAACATDSVDTDTKDEARKGKVVVNPKDAGAKGGPPSAGATPGTPSESFGGISPNRP